MSIRATRLYKMSYGTYGTTQKVHSWRRRVTESEANDVTCPLTTVVEVSGRLSSRTQIRSNKIIGRRSADYVWEESDRFVSKNIFRSVLFVVQNIFPPQFFSQLLWRLLFLLLHHWLVTNLKEYRLLYTSVTARHTM